MSENKRVTIPFLVKVLKPIVDLICGKADKTDIVQSDWNQADETKNDFIKNKPTIPTVPTNVSAFTNDAGYLTQHQDLSAYATKQHASQHQSPNVILWDGDETGHTVVTGSDGTVYVHVSDVVPTEDEIYDNASALGVNVNSGQIFHNQIHSEDIEVTSDGLIEMLFVGIVPSDNFIDTTYGVTFPKKGIYFTKSSDANIYVSYFYLSNVTFTTPSDPLTAEMIGAAQASHEHDAAAINGGTFGNAVYAGNQTPSYSLLRNSKLVSTAATPTANGEIYWTYE